MVKNLNRKERLKKGLLKLGEVAQKAECLPSTVRYYSNHGLLKVSGYTQGRYRLFKERETLHAMAEIKKFKDIGLTLDKIKARLLRNGL